MFLTPQQYFASRRMSPRKRFGQHFLAQAATAQRIVDSAGLSPDDVAVEVGPGLGALTRFLLPRVRRLHLVEIDRDLGDYLAETLGASYPHVTVHRMDVLDFDFRSLADQEGQRLAVIGNLPYNISSPLLFRLLEVRTAIRSMVFMVQKEVGLRWTALPGSGDYGVLSVLLGVYAQSRRLFDVGPGQFYPRPQVDSTVASIRLDPPGPQPLPSYALMRSLLNAAFQKRRKTLSNSLRGFGGVDGARLQSCLSEAGIDGTRRPETLSAEEAIRLCRAFQGGGDGLENRARPSGDAPPGDGPGDPPGLPPG
ncbi:MAG: 16S rRNA (adenine(1518)-N(6)/adenine(1519)-N(6))-dimethyltransferase RsmA [Syntrophobacteraceae bacterium]|nr:16S rRNA (adenine(1518)-N(6)/adenine(1519)-N(6))-dimethyltransferase RsmA [Syntrophobacteraceae bacterium]